MSFKIKTHRKKKKKKKKHSDLTQNIFMCCAPLARVNTVSPPLYTVPGRIVV